MRRNPAFFGVKCDSNNNDNRNSLGLVANSWGWWLVEREDAGEGDANPRGAVVEFVE